MSNFCQFVKIASVDFARFNFRVKGRLIFQFLFIANRIKLRSPWRGLTRRVLSLSLSLSRLGSYACDVVPRASVLWKARDGVVGRSYADGTRVSSSRKNFTIVRAVRFDIYRANVLAGSKKRKKKKKERRRKKEKNTHKRKGIINKNRIGSRSAVIPTLFFLSSFTCHSGTCRSARSANRDRCRFVTLRSSIGKFIDFLSRTHWTRYTFLHYTCIAAFYWHVLSI